MPDNNGAARTRFQPLDQPMRDFPRHASDSIEPERPAVPAAVSRVMLLDQGWPQTGYLVAALHEAGIRTTLLSTANPDAVGLAHYCEQIKTPGHLCAEYVPFLREQVARCAPELLIPLCEPLIELLWSLDPPPAPVFPHTEPWQRQIVTDRKRLYAFASALGVPIAPWTALEGAEDLGPAAQRLGFPLVLRGTAGCAGSQVRIARSPQEARAAFDALREISPGKPFAQAFAAGERQLFGGLFLHGEALRSYAQVTLECWPQARGPSIRVRTVHDATMEAHSLELMRRLNWSGMACVEYIRGKNDELVLLEVNVRPWAALEVAERCGAGICRAFAAMLCNRPVTPRCTYRAGRESLILEGFVRAHRRASIWRTFRCLSVRNVFLCLRAVPWRKPWLALHMLRRVYRACT